MLGLCSRGTGEGSMAENSEIERSNDDGEQQQTSVSGTTTSVDCHQQKQPAQLQTQVQLQPTGHDAKTDRKVDDSAFNNQRVFKKSSPNNKLTLYLVSRDLVVNNGKIDTLQGVLLVDPDYVRDKKVFGQVTLTFRYGREDEEVMGLKFCTEAVVYRAQLYPPYPGADHLEATTSLQMPIQYWSVLDSNSAERELLPEKITNTGVSDIREALLRRLGPHARAFSMEIPPVVPPSVQLLPAKEYNGAPIGTSYDVKAYVADQVEEKLHRNTTVRMGIRVMQRTTPPPLPSSTLYTVPHKVSNLQECKSQLTRIIDTKNETTDSVEPPAPHAAVEKPFRLSGGAIRLEARLDRAIYAHGDSITVHVSVTNDSHKSIKRVQVLVLQHVDVCMFNSGKFKNVVAVESERENCPIGPGSKLTKNYYLRPVMGSTKNWMALEDNYTKAGSSLASTVVCSGNGDKDKDPFAINVSYYVKVKLLISLMSGVVSLKLPFTLMHRNTEPDFIGFSSPVRECEEKGETCKEKTNDIVDESITSKDNDLTEIKSFIGAKEKVADPMADVDLIEHSEEPEST